MRLPPLTLLLLLLNLSFTIASPVALDPGLNLLLSQRACALPCGYNNQLCCAANEVCYTDSNNQAQCSTSSPASGPTSTVIVAPSSPTPTAGTACIQGQTQCGTACCAQGQICQGNGVCALAGGGGASGVQTLTVTSTAAGGAVAVSTVTTSLSGMFIYPFPLVPFHFPFQGIFHLLATSDRRKQRPAQQQQRLQAQAQPPRPAQASTAARSQGS
jgi:hypothetical protein